MFNRLSKIDLPNRLSGRTPKLFTQIALAITLLLIVWALRRLIDVVAPGTAPFALLFPAVLAATLIAGWVSGTLVMGIGGAYTWAVVMARYADPGKPGQVVSLVLYIFCAAAIVAFAEAHRANVRAMQRGQRELRASEERLGLAAKASGVGVWEWRLANNEMIYSAEAKTICGFAPDATVTLEMVIAVTHPDDHPHTSAQAARALDPEIRDPAPYEYRIVTRAGEERCVVANGRAVFETVDGVTVATRYVGTLQDVTAERRAEAERTEAATRLRLAVDAGRMAVWQYGMESGLRHNAEVNRLLGFADDARPTGQEIGALYLPGEQDRIRKISREALAQGERFIEVEFRIRRPDGALRWLMLRAELEVGPEGARSATGVLMDVTERKDAEERLQLLAREVDHRANNLLAVVQGTIQLSQANSADGLKEVLVGRVAALGRAHQLLSEARWEGADLRRLVEEELLAFSLGEAARVSIEGPDVALSPPAAQALAMALHELATNATKYGALSVPAGRVAVAWTRTGPGPLNLTWTESGGPLVTKPSRRGLGTAMLARALAGPLRGTSSLDWRPEGLVCELELPGVAFETALTEGG